MFIYNSIILYTNIFILCYDYIFISTNKHTDNRYLAYNNGNLYLGHIPVIIKIYSSNTYNTYNTDSNTYNTDSNTYNTDSNTYNRYNTDKYIGIKYNNIIKYITIENNKYNNKHNSNKYNTNKHNNSNKYNNRIIVSDNNKSLFTIQLYHFNHSNSKYNTYILKYNDKCIMKDMKIGDCKLIKDIFIFRIERYRRHNKIKRSKNRITHNSNINSDINSNINSSNTNTNNIVSDY
ncbi:hypothetical protein EHP00_2225 [Ecytonucleospora hepatopenaei]|uniref:Uncharacterized protein n=1 Tax=Ecytonucleospora hepatopenaei TaxID=646526 RepID=A0A1W0E4B3_9MICR|nr:hypothetical protein EHP00_2225 [Ecytonucleospora hepatopenaei]